MKFNYFQPTKIYFGQGRIQDLPNLINEYGSKVLLLGPELNPAIAPMFERIEKILASNGFTYQTFYKVLPNPDTQTVDQAFTLLKDFNPDMILAVGGGSVMDSAKILSITHEMSAIDWSELYGKYDDFGTEYQPLAKAKLPVLAVPTTSGTGSQCTHACVITNQDGMKVTVFHPQAFINKAILDPDLTLTLPPKITSDTAFDAFAHSLESYLHAENYICDLLAKEAIAKIFHYLPLVLKDNTIMNRQNLMIADTMAGIALTNKGAMLPHPLAEIIGSFIKISHGHSLAIVYPAFIKNSLSKYASKYAELARYIDHDLATKSDSEAATAFYQMLLNVMQAANLCHSIYDVEQDQAKLDKIKEFILSINLKIEEKSIIEATLNDIFMNRKEK